MGPWIQVALLDLQAWKHYMLGVDTTSADLIQRNTRGAIYVPHASQVTYDLVPKIRFTNDGNIRQYYRSYSQRAHPCTVVQGVET